MEQLVQVQILAQNIIEFSNAMTAGLEAVLDNKLCPSLVPENLRSANTQWHKGSLPSFRTTSKSTS